MNAHPLQYMAEELSIPRMCLYSNTITLEVTFLLYVRYEVVFIERLLSLLEHRGGQAGEYQF